MPRKTTEIRLAADEQEAVLQLSPMDLALLMASQARAEKADMAAQVAYLRHQLGKVQCENDALKNAEKYRLLMQATSQSINSAKQDLEGAKETHKALTQGLAQKYKVDWATCAYNEDSGVITPAPKE